MKINEIITESKQEEITEHLQLNEVDARNFDSDEDYYNALKAPAKRSSAPSDYPYSQQEDDDYFREIFRKKREAAKKAEQDGQQGMAEGSLEEDKGMKQYWAFKREWRAKHGANAKVPGYDSREYTAWQWRQADKQQGVAEAPVQETIKKIGSQYEVVSKSGKNMGKSPTKAGAVKRLGQVEYFKHHPGK
jgi:hypothetical protein